VEKVFRLGEKVCAAERKKKLRFFCEKGIPACRKREQPGAVRNEKKKKAGSTSRFLPGRWGRGGGGGRGNRGGASDASEGKSEGPLFAHRREGWKGGEGDPFSDLRGEKKGVGRLISIFRERKY